MAGGRKRRKRAILQGITHGRSGYARGCGCDVCMGEERDYQRWCKARRAGATDLPFKQWQAEEREDEVATVTQLHVVEDDEDEPERPTVRTRAVRAKVVGEMEQAVIDECQHLSLAVERPAMVMAARNAAKIMDTPKQAALHTQANRQMVAILNDLRGNSKKKSGGRLAKVQAMTRKTNTG